MTAPKYPTATKRDVLRWLKIGIYRIVENDDGTVSVFKGDYELKQRVNKRNGCGDNGDPRVDLNYDGKRKSIHVSHLVWMSHTRSVIPKGWELHHFNEDCTNNHFSNIVILHPEDHKKYHRKTNDEPF